MSRMAADLVHVELSKKTRSGLTFKKIASAALPEPEGVGTALRLSYLRSEPTGGAAPINCRVWSRSSCRNWSCRKVGVPARPAALVTGID